MILEHILTHGLFYSFVVTGSLFLMMVTLSPRVWGYSDYPQKVKDKVPPQTSEEKKLAGFVAIPWLLFVLVFPIYSTWLLKAKMADEIPVMIAFLNLLVMFLLVTFGDMVILDWLIISKITPDFVVIPGSDIKDYKDFSYHYKGHSKAAAVLIPILFVIAGIISYI